MTRSDITHCALSRARPRTPLPALGKRLGRKSRLSGRISYRFDSVAKHSEFPDHCCRVALLGLFRHCRAAFFIANAVMQNYPG